MKYTITATYSVIKELEVEVPLGADPKDPTNWGDIQSEHDIDCSLFDVTRATPSKE